jgi:hypothetical protein
MRVPRTVIMSNCKGGNKNMPCANVESERDEELARESEITLIGKKGVRVPYTDEHNQIESRSLYTTTVRWRSKE